MITISKPTQNAVFTKNPVKIEGSTDNYVLNSALPQVMLLTAPIPNSAEPDEVWSWRIGELEFEWIFKPTPDASGYQIQEDISTWAQFSYAVRNQMNRCPAFAQNTVIVDPNFGFGVPGFMTLLIIKGNSPDELEFLGSSNVPNNALITVSNTPSVAFSARTDFRILCQIYKQLDVEILPVIQQLSNVDAHPNNEGDFVLNLQTALRPYLQWHMVDIETAEFQNCPGMAMAFWLRIFEMYYNGSQEVWEWPKELYATGIETDLSGFVENFDGHYLAAFHGKMPLEEFDESLFMEKYIDYSATKNFLTHRPRESSSHKKEPIWLYYTSIEAKGSHNLVAKLYLSNGATDTSTIKSFTPTNNNPEHWVHAVPVGIANNLSLETFIDGRDVVKYEVWLTDETDTQITEAFTFVLDDRDYEEINYILFESPLGGLDTIRVTGAITAVDYSTGDVVHLAAKQNNSEAFFEMVNNNRQEGFSINTGHRKTIEEIEWARQILNSENVYLLRENKLTKLIVEREEAQPWSNRDSLFALTFNCRLAYYD